MREILGLKPGERAAGRFQVEQWIGISLDEAAMRVKPSSESWITNRYPLAFDVPMTRGDCLEWLKKRGFPAPKRSACWDCPFQSRAEWRMLQEHPEEWAKAVDFDERLRREKRFISSFGSEKATLRGVPFLHSSRVPLAEANLYNVSDRQLDFFQEDCLGMCGN